MLFWKMRNICGTLENVPFSIVSFSLSRLRQRWRLSAEVFQVGRKLVPRRRIGRKLRAPFPAGCYVCLIESFPAHLFSNGFGIFLVMRLITTMV